MTLKSKLSDLARFKTIVQTLGRYGFGALLKEFGLVGKPLNKEDEITAPERLRKAFEELGPTFIKLGQLISTRPDIFPENYIAEFSVLTDQVSPISFSEIQSILEGEFDQDIHQIFSSIEETPIAAASIAQVHRAVLSDSGQPVVIKVQRPGIGQIIQSDVQILYVLAKALEKIHEDFRLLNMTAIVQEFQRSIYEELDFTLEAKNIDRFHENFPELEGVQIPTVIWSATTQRVLTMTELKGLPFSQLHEFPSSIDRHFLATSLVTFFFESMLFHGLFHADAHPGNVLIIEDGDKGQIGLLDFGMVGTLGPKLREKLTQLFMAIISQDFETMASLYVDIGDFKGNFSLREFQADIERLLSPHMRKPIREVDISQLLIESSKVARRYKIRLPRDLVMFYRSLITLDHLGRRLDPEFEFFSYGRQFGESIAKRRLSKEFIMRDFWRFIEGIRTFGTEVPLQLKQLLRQLEKQNSLASQSDPSKLDRQIQQLGNRIVFLGLTAIFFFGSILLLQSNAHIGFTWASWGITLLSIFGLLWSWLIG